MSSRRTKSGEEEEAGGGVQQMTMTEKCEFVLFNVTTRDN